MPSRSKRSDNSPESLNSIKTDGNLAPNPIINLSIQLGSGDGIMAVADAANILSAHNIVAASVDEDLLTDLDMNPTPSDEEGISDAEIMAALHEDDPAASDPVAPVDEWLTDVQELARKHGPLSAAQILQIVRELDVPGSEAGR
jgi:hypothetical protein